MTWDFIVIGAGPNGLTAAMVLARAGRSVLVLEAAEEIGGGARTVALTQTGFLHDICSAIHPLAVASPALRRLPVDWVHPDAPLAHPLDGGRAVMLERSLAATAKALGPDAEAYGSLYAPPFLQALRSITGWSRARLRTPEAAALLAGIAGHSGLRLEDSPSAAFALALGAAAHYAGWPFPRGGAGRIADALAWEVQRHGGRIETETRVHSLADLPRHRVVLCDVAPRELLRIGRGRFPGWYRRRLERYRHGPGAFKVDWALDAPIPWSDPACRRAGTLHLGGTAEEIADSERAVWEGRCPEYPLVIAAQHSLFDPSRAPEGKHTAWAYCHVPNGATENMTERIERQIERFAPGFRDRIRARSMLSPSALEALNPNLVGGDVTGGANTFGQLIRRPSLCLYHTPDERVLLCSAATPPGGGVHGMCGFLAAKLALRRMKRG